MAAFQKFNAFVEDVTEKVHNLQSDALKIELTNVAPVATNTVIANITDIAAGFGYTAGGNAVTITSSAQTSGTYRLIGNDVSWTASGGSIGPFRYAVLYNSTPGAGPLIGWWDNGSPITLTTGNTFTVDLDQVGGILTLV